MGCAPNAVRWVLVVVGAYAGTMSACGETETETADPVDAGTDASAEATGAGGVGSSSAGGTSGLGASGSGGGYATDAGDGGDVVTDAACVSVSQSELDAAISAFCEASIVMPCAEWGTSTDACETQVHAALPELDPCCLNPLVAQLLCGATYGFRCSNLSFDLLFAPECSEVEEVADQCLGYGDNCSMDFGFGACQIECDQYATDCVKLDGGGYECTCTFGPHVGKKFSATDPCDPPGEQGAGPCK